MAVIKVLHVTTSFPSSADDTAGPFIYRLVENLQKGERVTCTILTPGGITKSNWPRQFRVVRFPYGPKQFQTLAQGPGGIPQALKERKVAWLMLPLLASSMFLWVRRLARVNHVVHAHWSASGAICSLACSRSGLVVTLHGSDVNRARPGNLYHKLLKQVLHRSDIVAVVSKEMMHRLKKEFPQKANKIKFVPNGVDQAFFKIDPYERVNRKHTNFLYVGSLIPGKGVHDLLAAFGTVEEIDGRLIVAGDGKERKRLEAMANNLGITSRVTFLGRVSPRAIPGLMKESDCLVLPSYAEGRPSVVLEAMAAALPVIASDISGNRELVNPGKTGYLVPPGNVRALAHAIKKLVLSKQKQLDMGLEGRKWMLQQGLTWQETAKRYTSIYKEIIAKKVYSS